MTLSQRVLIIAVDDTDYSERACAWALENLYRQGDDVHLLHVVPRLTVAAQYGAPPIDLLPQQDPYAYETLLKEAEEFIKARFIPNFKDLLIEPIVHLIKSEVDADAIGRVICKKADDLGACAVVMAKRNQPRIKEFFMGSVCKFCVANCKYPVVVIH